MVVNPIAAAKYLIAFSISSVVIAVFLLLLRGSFLPLLITLGSLQLTLSVVFGVTQFF